MIFVCLMIDFIPAFTIQWCETTDVKCSSSFQVRSSATKFQEHVQTDAAAEEVAGGGRLHHGHLGLHRQDRRAGKEAEKANLHRGLDQGGVGTAL